MDIGQKVLIILLYFILKDIEHIKWTLNTPITKIIQEIVSLMTYKYNKNSLRFIF